MPETNATARFKEIAFEEYNVKSRTDTRKRVNRLVIGYETKNGDEYRRSFEFDPKFSYTNMLECVPQEITVKSKDRAYEKANV
jgi:hypothetical protein